VTAIWSTSARIGTGYTRKTAEQLFAQLKSLTVEESPFGGENAPRRERNVRWLRLSWWPKSSSRDGRIPG